MSEPCSPVSLCLCPLRLIKADYPACRRRSAHSLLPLDLLTPPVACPRGAHAGEERRWRDGGPAATSHSAPVPGRGSYSSPLLCWAFWPLRVGGGVKGGWGGGGFWMHRPHATSSTCLAPGARVRPIRHTQICTATHAHYCWMTPEMSTLIESDVLFKTFAAAELLF